MQPQHIISMTPRMVRNGLIAASLAFALLAGCDGPHEKAGKQVDKAAGIKPRPFQEGPQQRLGELQDRAERDQARAIDARADTVRDQAKAVRSVADSQADALEQQAAQVRAQAKQTGRALDQQAGAIRGK